MKTQKNIIQESIFLFLAAITATFVFFAIGCGNTPPPSMVNGSFTLASDSNELLLNADVPGLDRNFFVKSVLPMMTENCTDCHDNYAPDYETATTYVVAGSPDKSVLYTNPIGKTNKHKAVLKATSAEAALIFQWISGAKAEPTN